MRSEKIETFDIEINKSTLHGFIFGIVRPEGVEVDEKKVKEIINGYIHYHLAIKPGVPVVLFSLETLISVGSRVYSGDEKCSPIYHLPPRSYNLLEDVIAESPFIVSDTYLVHAINTQRLHASIFASMREVWQTQGLNVLGMHHEVEA